MKANSRRQFLKTATRASLFLSLLNPIATLYSNKTKKPNFVLLIADDCTYWDLGCYGSKDAITPNIDKLARQGMRFTQCFQAAPMCSPTRHNLYTGIYPVKTGAYPNHTFAKEGTKSIVHYLSQLGYRVALAGKRHIAPESVFPFEYLPGNKNPDFDAVDQFISNSIKTENPFCLFLCSNEPHTPWDKGDSSRFDADSIWMPPFMVDTPETRKNYCDYLAEINYLDGQVGEALQLLDKHGIEKDTLFIFLSEQGNSFPFAKWTCFEAGVRSACLARWSGKIAAGTVSDAIIEYSDVVPTLVEAAGGDIAKAVDGVSFLPVLTGEKPIHKKYAFSLQTTRGINNGSDSYGIRSVRSETYRYIWNLTAENAFENNITNQESEWWNSWLEKAKTDTLAASLVEKYQHRPKEELYDVKADKYCLNNLADLPEYKKIKSELRTELLLWMEACGDEGQKTEMEALRHQSENRRERWLRNRK